MTNEQVEYRNQIKGVFKRFRAKIENAPGKRTWNRTMGISTPSQYDLMKQRDAVIKDIVNEAACMGVTLDLNLKDEDKYESPFEKTTDE